MWMAENHSKSSLGKCSNSYFKPNHHSPPTNTHHHTIFQLNRGVLYGKDKKISEASQNEMATNTVIHIWRKYFVTNISSLSESRTFNSSQAYQHLNYPVRAFESFLWAFISCLLVLFWCEHSNNSWKKNKMKAFWVLSLGTQLKYIFSIANIINTLDVNTF